MAVDFLRSCHSSQWRFYANDPSIITRGHYYFVPRGTPFLPFPHDFYSGTWSQGDPAHTSTTGPVQSAARPWRDGVLEISFPPAIPVGSEFAFSDGLEYPADLNTSQLRAGIPSACWINAGVPFLSLDTVCDLKNCCLRTAYARIIELIYNGEDTDITNFFETWLGQATVTHYSQVGLFPAMSFVVTSQYAMVFVSGTTTFQQIATQATTGFAGPSNFGSVRTIPLWFECATLIQERFESLGVDNTLPLLMAGHSYGGAAVAVLAIRQKRANPDKKLYVLTYGMPKPCDLASMRILETTNRMFVFNVNDFVPQIPLAFYQGNWFPSVLSRALREAWGEWAKSTEYLIQEINGDKIIDHLPDLSADQIIPLLTQVFLTGELAPISGHRIREYVIRSCRACRCPRWPFDNASWEILFDFVCGARGIRFAGEVVEKLPPLDPCARIRFSATVVNFPHAPPLCLSACFESSAHERLEGNIFPFYSNASQFTLCFFFKRNTLNSPCNFQTFGSTSPPAFVCGMFSDSRAYCHVPFSATYKFNSGNVGNDLNWHHLAMVYDGSAPTDLQKIKIYQDGISVADQTTGGIPSVTDAASSTIIVGPYEYFGLNADADVRYIIASTQALPAADIAKLASNTRNPYAVPGLCWFVPFTEGQGVNARDYSGNFGLLTFLGGAEWCGYCLPLDTARIKFHVDVRQGGWDGDPIPAKIKLRTELHNPVPPGDAIPAKLRLRAAAWSSPLPPATRSIYFNSLWSQYQTYGFSPVLGTALTVFFWAKISPSSPVGAASSYSNFFPRYFRLRVFSTSPLTVQLDMEKPAAFIGEVYHATGTGPASYGWHLYFLELYDVPTFPAPAKFYIDNTEIILNSPSIPTTWTAAWFGSGIFRVGSDGAGAYATGGMKNVGLYDGIFSPAEKAALVSCEVDPIDLGAARLFEYEIDEDPRAWETVTADQVLEFKNFPIHKGDVPPLMQ